MELFTVTFQTSQVTTWIFLPPLVAFVVSFFTSMAGVSGAFVLLPFQMSVLGYTSPSVSGTNQFYNIVAIPSGVYRYMQEGRMVWPLTWAVILGTLPGTVLGGWVRLELLPDARDFKLFAGLVLLYIGLRLLRDVLWPKTGEKTQAGQNQRPPRVTDAQYSLARISFRFGEQDFAVSGILIFLLCFAVGIVGGVYGIGGGALIAPFFVTFYRLPIHAVAGASLMGTLVTSVVGVFVYQGLAAFYPEVSVAPDWYLGLLFGVGGFCGMYLGSTCQKYFPARLIKLLLCVSVLFVTVGYIVQFFR